MSVAACLFAASIVVLPAEAGEILDSGLRFDDCGKPCTQAGHRLVRKQDRVNVTALSSLAVSITVKVTHTLSIEGKSASLTWSQCH